MCQIEIKQKRIKGNNFFFTFVDWCNQYVYQIYYRIVIFIVCTILKFLDVGFKDSPYSEMVNHKLSSDLSQYNSGIVKYVFSKWITHYKHLNVVTIK